MSLEEIYIYTYIYIYIFRYNIHVYIHYVHTSKLFQNHIGNGDTVMHAQLHHGDSVIQLCFFVGQCSVKTDSLHTEPPPPINFVCFPVPGIVFNYRFMSRPGAPGSATGFFFHVKRVGTIFFSHLGADFEQANVKTGGQVTTGQLSTPKNFPFSSADTCSERILVQPGRKKQLKLETPGGT